MEAEAAAERREARQRLAAEIGELEGLRESLRSDVSVLERHVEEQRSQLGSTLAELHQILDDPSGFRLAPAPALSDPDIPDFSDLDEPEPEVVAAEPVTAAAPAEPVVEDEPEPVAEVEVVEAEVEVEPEPEPEPAPPASPALSFDEADHEAPGIEDPIDPGPPTAPVSAVDLGLPDDRGAAGGEDEDAFLTELRKAMADEEPLGPRDLGDPDPGDTLFDDPDRRGFRFGRRR